MNNPFLNPGFSMASLTAAINLIPNRYGRLEALNLFPAKPVRTRQIIVEEYAGRLNLLPTKPPGSPGTVGERGKRKLRSFVIPHIPHDDVVLPEEVQGIRAFGSETEMEAIVAYQEAQRKLKKKEVPRAGEEEDEEQGKGKGAWKRKPKDDKGKDK